MVVKKRGLYLGLLLSLLGIGNVIQTYTITIKNTSNRIALVRVVYHKATNFPCRRTSAVEEVSPDGFTQISSECAVKKVEAEMFQKGVRRKLASGESTGTIAKPYTAPSYKTGAGDMTLIISGTSGTGFGMAFPSRGHAYKVTKE